MAKVPFDKNLPIIQVSAVIQGKLKRILRMALDTGASKTIVPWEAAIAIGYSPETSKEKTRLITGSGVEYAPVIKVKKFQALGKSQKNFKVVCHDLPKESFVDGLIGLDFLRKFDIQIRFKKGVIEIE